MITQNQFIMDYPPDLLYPDRPCHKSPKHSRDSSPKSSSRKPQKLLSTVKDFVHRTSRSVTSLPTSKSANELTITHPHWPPRSTSMNSSSSAPSSSWKQRGKTPGMDDYLTLAELEHVWYAQDSYVGGVEAPQRATSYTYIEPVEAPTTVKHQVKRESARPALPQLRIPENNSPSPQRVEQQDEAVVNVIPDPSTRLSSAPASVPSSPDSYIELSSRQPDPSVTQVRNAVVSGVVHPALRPTPYFENNATSPSCRVASRFAVDVPSSNWTYGRV